VPRALSQLYLSWVQPRHWAELWAPDSRCWSPQSASRFP